MSRSTFVEQPATAATIDLTSVVSAVGGQIFSYLSLGSLLNGFKSPLLVSKTFRFNIFLSLCDWEILDFSQCPHLRKITDYDLQHLIQNIIWRAEIGQPVYQRDRIHTDTYMKVKNLDFSRCRVIEGNGIRYAIHFMPALHRISLASCSKLDAINFLIDDGVETLDNMHFLDLSGCRKVKFDQLGTLLVGLGGARIRLNDTIPQRLELNLIQLDVSHCSHEIDDASAGLIARFAPNLERINLSGAKKLTQNGLGLIAWMCRSTLKIFCARGCYKIELPYLITGMCQEIANTLTVISNPQEALPPNMVEGHNPNVGTIDYLDELKNAMHELISARHPDLVAEIVRIANDLVSRLKMFENEYRPMQDHDVGLFGRLEELEIELVGSIACTTQGCIATIAWLTGGRLQKLKVTTGTSPAYISAYDVAILQRLCGPHLKILEIDATVSFELFNGIHVPALSYGTNLTELDLSNSSGLIKDGNVTFLRSLHKLRSLKLNCLEFMEDGLHDCLSTTTSLLRLSIWHCSTVKCSRLSQAIARNDKINLLELDARDIDIDSPLSVLRQSCPSLLRLNNRCTEIGRERIKHHIHRERWRVGARNIDANPSLERKGLRYDKLNTVNNKSNFNSGDQQSKDICSILNTGFSQSPNTEQQFFICTTCKINFGHVVCSACIRNCHVGHEIMYSGYSSGYCDCCILSDCQYFKQLDGSF